MRCGAKLENGKKIRTKRERESLLRGRNFALTPYLTPRCFSAHISLRRPHNLNSWNRSLHFSIGGNDVSQGHLKSFLGASEMLAMEMKASGMYVSRGLSFRQAEVMHNFRNGIVIFCCKQKFFYHTEI